jgi:hypothetical protein
MRKAAALRPVTSSHKGNTKGLIMKKLDITSFNAVKDADNFIKLDMKLADGEPSGVIFHVIGKHAEAVQSVTRKIIRQQQNEEAIAKRKGKEPAPKTIEELEETGIELAAARVIGWEGVEQDFDKEILKVALKNNPHWVEQVVDESNNDGNFTKAS